MPRCLCDLCEIDLLTKRVRKYRRWKFWRKDPFDLNHPSLKTTRTDLIIDEGMKDWGFA